MVNLLDNFRVEEHLHSVKDIKKPTHCAEDVAEWASINKTEHALLVDTQPLDLEDVFLIIIADGWSLKVQQRKGPGTGRQRYTKTIPRIFKNNLKGLNWSLCYYLNFFCILLFIYFFYFLLSRLCKHNLRLTL